MNGLTKAVFARTELKPNVKAFVAPRTTFDHKKLFESSEQFLCQWPQKYRS